MGKRVNRGNLALASDKQNRVVSQKDILAESDEIRFSYKYLELQHDKFCVDCQHTEYFIKLITRLVDVSRMTVTELRLPGNNKSIRSHCIKWHEVSEDCFGIPNEDEIVTEPWQFSVTSNEHGRVHGFIIGNTFFVRWFDPEHKLYN